MATKTLERFRRSLSVFSVVSVVCLFLSACGGTKFTRSADQNVLLITIDTWRADALGIAGERQISTPVLDSVAQRGIRFTFAHAHTPLTLPSHASILTGLYPFTHGIRDNSGYRLKRETPTLATKMKAAGYATGAFVGAFPLDSRFGLDAGFDEYDDRYSEASRANDLAMPERPAGPVVDLANAWIRKQTGKWLAWVHVYDPHSPYRPPEPFDKESASAPYYGEVAYVDRELGRLLETIRASARPTLVIVTGDHGEALGSHGEQTHGIFAYEATLKVPLMVSFEGSRPGPATVSDLPARHVDILPTILDALGQPAAGDLPGRSLLAAVEAQDKTEVPTYFEALSASLNRGWAPLTGILLGREKYIDLPFPELYDLVADAEERTNLLPARDDRRKVLEARLRSLAPAGTAADARIRENAETMGRLAALGYVSGSTGPKKQYTVRDDPKGLIDIDTTIQQAVTAYQAGERRRALALYNQVLLKRDDTSIAYLHAAFIHWDLGEAANAIDLLKRGLAAGAGSPDVAGQLGIYLAEAGQPDEAIKLLTPLAKAPTPDVEILNGLGIALARAGQTQPATAAFNQVLAIDATNAAALQNLGTVNLGQGNLAAARDAIAKALAIDPQMPRALNGLGVIEMKSGNRAAAIDAWKRAVAADPRQYDTLFNLGVTLAEAGNRAEARKYFEQFLKTAPPAFYEKDLVKVRGWLKTL